MIAKSLALGCAAIAFTVALAPALYGQEQAPNVPSEESATLLDFGSDATARMTVPVNISGTGPYSFIVDTGAERTVISRELAHSLALGPGRLARVHSMTEVSDIGTVLIPRLNVGGKDVNDINAPALLRRNLGAQGMLGVDALQTQRVVFDFVRQEMSISPSRKVERKWPSDTIVVTARNRFGHLILVDASVEGEKIYAVVDTGSQVTIGNNALRRKLEKKGKLGRLQSFNLISITGGSIMAEQARVRQMRIGDVEINDLPIAFADVHPFKKLDLTDRPAILLGMDALQLFDRVSVDFANHRMRLLRPDKSELAVGTRMAMRAKPGRRPAA